MKANELQALQPAQTYVVVHKTADNDGKATQSKAVRRVFKGIETRFGAIPCAIFTSKVGRNVTAQIEDEMLVISGRKVPRSEISIPHYDLVSVLPATS